MNQRKRMKFRLPVIGLALIMLALAGCGGGGGGSVPVLLAPAQPTGVTVLGQDAQATISWTAVTGATSYNVYYSTTAGVTPSNGTKIADATNPQVVPATGGAPLTNSTTYHFIVTAVNANGESAPSSEVSATPITKPQGIVASAENGQATVAWLSVQGATSYNLYYGTANPVTLSNSKIPVTVAAAGTSNGTPFFQQTVTGLTNSSTYYFAVTAVNASGFETVLSSQKSAVPSATSPKPGSPAAVTVSSPLPSQVHIVWGDYVPDALSYNAYYLQAAASPAPTTATVMSTGTKVSLTLPSPNNLPNVFTSGANYWFVVTAVNGSGVESVGQTSPKAIVVQ